MIVVISGLSYLGLGVQPPAPEWGTMLKEARLYMSRAPWLLIAPGTAVSLSVLAFNLLGEGLKDYFQVRPAGQW
jgi:ABC-type dipeptide/oligopeptide/nickel transport system permease subunit